MPEYNPEYNYAWMSGAMNGAVGVTTAPMASPVPSAWTNQFIQLTEPLSVEIAVGCPRCKRQRPLPEGIRIYASGPFGCCGQCGGPLKRLYCGVVRLGAPGPCQEPLHANERYCRSCGRENLDRLVEFGMMADPKAAQELAARGNVEEPGSIFRGVREE